MTINIIGKEKQPLTINEIFQTWQKLKARYMDAIVILRKENEYYTFDSDAVVVSGIMHTELWELRKVTKVSIVPFYETDKLLSNMIKAGYRIAVCEPQFFNSFQ